MKNMTSSDSSSLHHIPYFTISPPSSSCLASADPFPVLMLDKLIDGPGYIVLLCQRHHVTVIGQPNRDLGQNPVLATFEHIHHRFMARYTVAVS
jgi:hypothetical protein